MKYWRTPLDHDQVKLPRGRVLIIADRCKGCGFCVEYCPKDVLAMSDGFNKKGYHPPVVVKEGECVNCNLCELICPDFAIFSVAATDGTFAAEAAGSGASDAPRPAAGSATREEGH
jgi:2-oxoglutarate ferredoxin oxidoreductase subunit delta